MCIGMNGDTVPRGHYSVSTSNRNFEGRQGVGRNLGCGSSREHAPWVLVDYGFRAVVSSEIADIFRSNALKNRLVPVNVDDATSEWLFNNSGAQIEIDVEATVVSYLPALPSNSRRRRSHAIASSTASMSSVFLLSKEAEIASYESSCCKTTD